MRDRLDETSTLADSETKLDLTLNRSLILDDSANPNPSASGKNAEALSWLVRNGALDLEICKLWL
jgi:hypothetical protein